MLKKIFLIFAISILTNCGYEPIYSQKNKPNISIKDYKLDGNKILNRQIFSKLNLIVNKNNQAGYDLILNSSKTRSIISKDKAGNASIYKTTINSNISLKMNDKVIKTKNFSSSFTYNNLNNKSDLANYQRNIEKNLINKIAEEILIFLGI
jgi:hypothetical protein